MIRKKYDIDLSFVKAYVKSVQAGAKKRTSFLKDSTRHHAEGRIILGWRIIADGQGYAYWWNRVNRNRVEISTFEIVRRKIKRWAKRLT